MQIQQHTNSATRRGYVTEEMRLPDNIEDAYFLEKMPTQEQMEDWELQQRQSRQGISHEVSTAELK